MKAKRTVFDNRQSKVPAGAPEDLAARLTSILSGIDGRPVSTDALFETLRLEVLDWGFDHEIGTDMVTVVHEKPAAPNLA
jgi:hypothetical protein